MDDESVMVNMIGRRNAPTKKIAPVCNAVMVQLLPTFPHPETGEMQYVEAVSVMVRDPEMHEVLEARARQIIAPKEGE